MSKAKTTGQIQSIKASWSKALVELSAQIEDARATGDNATLAKLKDARSALIDEGWKIRAAETADHSSHGLGKELARLTALADEARKVTRRIDETAAALNAAARVVEILGRLIGLLS